MRTERAESGGTWDVLSEVNLAYDFAALAPRGAHEYLDFGHCWSGETARVSLFGVPGAGIGIGLRFGFDNRSIVDWGGRMPFA